MRTDDDRFEITVNGFLEFSFLCKIVALSEESYSSF